MKNNLIIIGAGSLALELLNYIYDIFEDIKLKKIYFLGNVKNKKQFIDIHKNSFFINSLPNNLKKNNSNFIISNGDEKIRDEQFKIYNKRFSPIKIIHPTAYVSSTAKISEGVIVGPKTILSSQCIIKKNVLLNSGCQIGHHSIIGESSIISTGAIINGNVVVGSKCFIGSNSTVMQNLKIFKSSKVTANSALYSNLKFRHIAHGNPAKQKKINF